LSLITRSVDTWVLPVPFCHEHDFDTSFGTMSKQRLQYNFSLKNLLNKSWPSSICLQDLQAAQINYESSFDGRNGSGNLEQRWSETQSKYRMTMKDTLASISTP